MGGIFRSAAELIKFNSLVFIFFRNNEHLETVLLMKGLAKKNFAGPFYENASKERFIAPHKY